jgi:hypothetical protein
MRTKVFIAIAATAALALAGGVAYGMIPDDQGVIHACYKTATGQLRVVDATDCLPAESPLSWNQAGPQGPTGPQGPEGSPGVLGFDTKQHTMDIPAQSEVFDGIECNSGDEATGSGYEPIDPDVQVVEDAPTNGLVNGQLVPHGWHFAVTNASDSSKEVQISVVCADLP